MKNILVPVDFSTASDVALKYTAELGRTLKANIRLLHVHNQAGSNKTQNVEKLQSLIDSLGERYSSVKWDTIVESGTIADVIISCAKKDTDMIAMGTQGMSSIDKAILGTHTAEIIEKAACPVLAIPMPTRPYAPRNILFATDYAAGDWKSAKVLTEMARELNGTITYLHVTRADDDDELAEEQNQIDKFTDEIKKSTDFPRIKSKIISDNNVFMGLDSVLQDSAVDLLCLSTRKRTLIEKLYNPSVTRKMAIHTQIPLLAFKV
ncbi:MAG TPA: universal stress protein [Chryseolinea sp.]|nr:universal stress protein [Chryseolinea sp.]